LARSPTKGICLYPPGPPAPARPSCPRGAPFMAPALDAWAPERLCSMLRENMGDIWDLLRRTNCAALVALGAIYLALLLLHGANNAAHATIFACLMLALLAVAALFAERRDVAHVLAASAVQIAATLAFILLALASAIPGLPAQLGMQALAHPLAHDLIGDAAAISLAPHRTIEGLTAFLGPAAAFLIGAITTHNRETRDWAGRWIVVLSVPCALMGVAMFFSYETDARARLDIGLGSADAAGIVLGMVILPAAAIIMRAGSGRFDGGEAAAAMPKAFRWARYLVSAPIALTAMILAFACMMLTASRGGLVALAIAIVVFGVCLAIGEARSARKRHAPLTIPFLVIAGIAALLFYRGGDFIAQRFAASAESSNNSHSLFSVHWRAFLQRPWVGNGFNTFHEINSVSGTTENWPAIGAASAAPNVFVQILEETGIVGAVLFALMLAPPLFRAAWRLARGSSGVEWSACAVAVAAFGLVQGAIDYGLQMPAIGALFAFMLGALVGDSDRRRDPEPRKKNSFRFRPPSPNELPALSPSGSTDGAGAEERLG
jgi:O-Antigen ligase